MQNILLTDLNSSNIGCEIIIRGTIKFLRENYNPKTNIILPTKTKKHDEMLFSDISNIQFEQTSLLKTFRRFLLRKIDKFISHYTPRISSDKFLLSTLVVSIGGDIYDLRKIIPVDQIGYELYATRHNIPIIMYGANMEGIENLTDKNRALIMLHLKRFQKIFVRDPETVVYLDKIGIKENIFFYPDPIFQLRPYINFRLPPQIKNIGINFSPFMLKLESEKKEILLKNFASNIEKLIQSGFNITLFPHVCHENRNPNLDDRESIKTLINYIKPEFKYKVKVIDDKLNLGSVTSEIKNFDLVIGARMHACLNSFTSGVSTIFIAYGKKAHSMVKWIKNESIFYNVNDYVECIDFLQIDDKALLLMVNELNGKIKTLKSRDISLDMSDYLNNLYLKSCQ